MLTSNTTGAITYLTMSGDSIINGVCAGDYTVMVTDSGLCSSSMLPSGNSQAIVNSTVSALTDPQIVITDNVDCFGGSTGEIQITNPDTNYTYYTYFILSSVQNVWVGIGTSASNLPSGQYFVRAILNQSMNVPLPSTSWCISYSDTLTIVDPDPLSVSGVVNASDCFGGSSGSISISVTGVTSNYTYQWDNGSTLSQLNNLPSGDYTVTITDANSCVLVDTFTVTQPSPINVSISRGSNNANNPAYFELSVNGSSASGGTAPYVYTWKREYPVGVFTNVGGGNNYTVYTAGTYSVTVIDANGCTVASNDFTYNNPPTSVVENSGVIKLEIYPNPFNDVAIVDFGRYISNSQLKIFNIVGELVDEYEVRETDKIEIERKEKVNGVYFAEIEIDDKKIFKKIIVE